MREHVPATVIAGTTEEAPTNPPVTPPRDMHRVVAIAQSVEADPYHPVSAHSIAMITVHIAAPIGNATSKQREFMTR